MSQKIENTKSQNKGKSTIIIIAIIALLALLVWGVISVVNADEGKAVPTEPNTTQNLPAEIITQEPTSDTHTFIVAKTITVDNDKWYLTLLNRNYKLPNNYVPKTKKILISAKDPRQTEKSKKQYMDVRAADKYQAMYDAAAKEGVYLSPYSGYRSIEFQTQIFNNYIKLNKDKGYSEEEAKYKASQTVLPPGTSEHNMGISMDILSTEKSFERTKEYNWLQENAHNYGFILRYPKDKTNITKIIYEPWHWRYVGVEAAVEMKQSGQCLEEYLANKLNNNY